MRWLQWRNSELTADCPGQELVDLTVAGDGGLSASVGQVDEAGMLAPFLDSGGSHRTRDVGPSLVASHANPIPNYTCLGEVIEVDRLHHETNGISQIRFGFGEGLALCEGAGHILRPRHPPSTAFQERRVIGFGHNNSLYTPSLAANRARDLLGGLFSVLGLAVTGDGGSAAEPVSGP